MDRKLIVTMLLYFFDLFLAVFAPMVVLAYAYYQFKMDRKEFAFRESAVSPGSYDITARLFADPVQVDVFRDGFSNMQLTKTTYIVAKICLNTLALYKWKKTIIYLIQHQHLEATQRQRGARQPRSSQIRLHGPQRKRHRFAGTLLFFSGIAFVATYTIVASTSSQNNCAPFQQCRVMSFEWHLSANDTACPCIVFIDLDVAPTTFDAWMNPIDVTRELAEVAKPGRLEAVQIVNSAVPTLPNELQNCQNFQELYVSRQHDRVADFRWVGETSAVVHLGCYSCASTSIAPAAQEPQGPLALATQARVLQRIPHGQLRPHRLPVLATR